MPCFKILSLPRCVFWISKVQLFLSQRSCMEVPLWDLAAAAEKTSCPRLKCPGGAGCQRDRASPGAAQVELGLQCKKRCKGTHKQKICEEGERRKCLETKNIVSGNMEMPGREIRERRIMKPEGFKVCSCTGQQRSGLSCSAKAQCEKTKNNQGKQFMA